MKKLQITATFLALRAFDWIERLRHPGAFVLANELAGRENSGVTTCQVDANQTVPVTNSYVGGGKYLVWMIGTASTATLRTAAVASGASTRAAFPLGISHDAPYQAGDWLDIAQFGARPGTMVGISAGAITDCDWVYSAANGLIGSVNTGNPGTVWVIGKATKTVTAIGQEISFIPMVPQLWTITQAGPPNTYALATPV